MTEREKEENCFSFVRFVEGFGTESEERRFSDVLVTGGSVHIYLCPPCPILEQATKK